MYVSHSQTQISTQKWHEIRKYCCGLSDDVGFNVLRCQADMSGTKWVISSGVRVLVLAGLAPFKSTVHMVYA